MSTLPTALDRIQQALSANQTIIDQRQAREQVQAALRPQAQTLTQRSMDQFPSPLDGKGITSAAFNSAVNKLIAAAGGKVKIKSGTRSPQRQAQLWADALKKYGSPEKARKWVAPPGHSKHELGLAADLAYADAATKTWVHQNAARFGLVFPLSNEDWHIELKGTRG